MPSHVEDNHQNGVHLVLDDVRTFPVKTPSLGSGFLHEPIPDQNICIACEEIDMHKLLGSGGGKSFHLGSAANVFACTDCDLCQILTKAFEIDIAPPHDKITRQWPDAFVILTSNIATYPIGPRRDRVFDLIARLIHPPALYVGDARLRLIFDDAYKIKRSPMMRGRLVNPSANMDLARSWLAECEENHDCGQLEEWQKQGNTAEQLLVLDIEQDCLVEIPMESRYVTLSYVWPRLPSMKLFTYLLDDWKRPLAILNDNEGLLNVFKDAMTVMEKLGERYIWIDQLCMAQDDPALKEYLVDRMDKVYGQAILNIVVATSTQPEEDYFIPVVNQARDRRQEIVTIENLHLITALPDYSVAVERTWWATRGWTFQEGVLPHRCLIFHDDQMYFRCRKDPRSEDVTAERNIEFQFHPAKPKVRKSGFENLLNPDLFSNVSSDNCFAEYASLVRDYSRRSLTHEPDILPAFKGIMTALLNLIETPNFFCGMPWHYFHRALLWYPASPMYRRTAEIKEDPAKTWPSWSWAGWVGRIDYEVDILHLGDARSVLPTVAWYFFESEQNCLVPIGGNNCDIASPLDSSFALGILYSHLDLLRPNLTLIVGWVSSFKAFLDPNERHIIDWLTDTYQSVPCFTILDAYGDPCGYLPSTDRDWSRKYKKVPGCKCEMIILSYSQQSVGEEHFTRIHLTHPKYKVLESSVICFYNVMLVEYDDAGIAYQQGIERIHIDALVDLERDPEAGRKHLILG